MRAIPQLPRMIADNSMQKSGTRRDFEFSFEIGKFWYGQSTCESYRQKGSSAYSLTKA